MLDELDLTFRERRKLQTEISSIQNVLQFIIDFFNNNHEYKLRNPKHQNVGQKKNYPFLLFLDNVEELMTHEFETFLMLLQRLQEECQQLSIICTSRLGSHKMFLSLEPKPILQCLLHLKCSTQAWTTVDMFMETTQAKITPQEIVELILKQKTPKYPIKEILPSIEEMPYPEDVTPEFKTELLKNLRNDFKIRKALACH